MAGGEASFRLGWHGSTPRGDPAVRETREQGLLSCDFEDFQKFKSVKELEKELTKASLGYTWQPL